MRIHLVVNTHRADAVEAARECISWIKARGVNLAADRESAEVLGIPALAGDELGIANLMISFGGDGTLIRAAHLCAQHRTPILGVYFGRFGFVTQCKPSELGVSLSEFFDGKSKFENRMMLRADLVRGGETVTTLHALNEISLQRDIAARMLSFRVVVDGRELTNYPADGVLASTPTGSTAYNLSAGGPILDPHVEAIVVSAIAPHTLSARPLVLSPSARIELTVQAMGDAVLSADGQSRLHLLSGDVLSITRSERVTTLVSVDSHDFLVKLGERLFWSQGLGGNWEA